MTKENEYSTKDSNRNRMIEERETNTYATIALIALVLILIGAVFYYVDLLRSEHRVTVNVSQKALSPTPAPPPINQDPDKAKPYDDRKPPYAQ